MHCSARLTALRRAASVGRWLIALAALTIWSTASADVGPDDEIYTPNVEAGETELEASAYWLSGNDADANRATEYRFGIGYGVTDFWRASISPVLVDAPGDNIEMKQVQIENVFQLTPDRHRGLDAGLLLSYEIATIDTAHDELVAGPVFAAKISDIQINANVFVDRAMVSAPDVGLSYGWQIKWPRSADMAIGLQGFGEHEYGDEDEEERETGEPEYAAGHRAGPVFFGQLPLGADDEIAFQFGLLLGLDDDAADQTVRFALEYEL